MTKKDKITIIKAAKVKITALGIARDKVFITACKKLGINPDSYDSNHLFDYMYNQFGTATEAVNNTWPANTAEAKQT